MSMTMLGPVVSGPKHQIFLAPMSLSHSYFSARYLPLAFGSSLGPTSPSSMASGRPSSSGLAVMYTLLCLFGDLDMTTLSEALDTVSLKDTTGSETLIGAPPMKSSWRSLRQISKCSSPAPAMICSPVSSMEHCTIGSDLARRFNPSTSFGRSEAVLHSTATRTTGDTENFMALIGWASTHFSLVRVAFLVMYWSSPTMATVFPQGTSSTASCLLPMHSTVLWTALMYKSFFCPGT
mmetsp:Transcript_4230/g.12796  ORF Transcript_4230/g.12796 Transcript_4230/m.12796 type:complete len:236 (-) Transcript_4230:1387-2094(-)